MAGFIEDGVPSSPPNGVCARKASPHEPLFESLLLCVEGARAMLQRYYFQEADCDDFISEGIVEAVEKLRNYDPSIIGSLQALFCCIVLRQALTYRRRRGRKLQLLAMDDVRLVEIPAPERVSEAEIETLLWAVKALPEKERSLVERHDFDDETLAKIAADLAIPAWQASRLHTKALRRLREEMELECCRQRSLNQQFVAAGAATVFESRSRSQVSSLTPEI